MLLFLYIFINTDVNQLTNHHHNDFGKYRKKIFRRHNSTGSVEVMNSHAFNLQTTGHHQSIVVGHHRGFSQPSSATTGGDPWFLQNNNSHEMPPIAPARHNKRPAPQPGLLSHSNGKTIQVTVCKIIE